ncbi:MAG: ubiquinol-cytochrome C chaperone family protein [Pseudomonadota bacterium]
MLKWWKSRTSQSNKADAVYTAVIEQARHPDFYTKFGVPDTMDGRYELIVLHLFLVMERLRGADDETSEIARRTLERFVEDMDDCMREQGVSDLRVPKKVQQAATGFYDRAKMLREHISPDAELGMDAYFSKVFDAGSDMALSADAGSSSVFIDALERYTIAASELIDKQAEAALIENGPDFPVPADHLAV